MDHESYADKIIKRTFEHITSGLNIDQGEETLQEMQAALLAMAKRLAQASQGAGHVCVECHCHRAPEARDIAHVTKALDECTRLLKFAQGEPDHRAAVSSEDQSVLRALKDWQVAQVLTWVEENATEGAREGA